MCTLTPTLSANRSANGGVDTSALGRDSTTQASTSASAARSDDISRTPHVLPRLRCNRGPIAAALFCVRVAEARRRIDFGKQVFADAVGHEERVETKAMRSDEAVALALSGPAHGFERRAAIATRRPDEIPRVRHGERAAGGNEIVRFTDHHARLDRR